MLQIFVNRLVSAVELEGSDDIISCLGKSYKKARLSAKKLRGSWSIHGRDALAGALRVHEQS